MTLPKRFVGDGSKDETGNGTEQRNPARLSGVFNLRSGEVMYFSCFAKKSTKRRRLKEALRKGALLKDPPAAVEECLPIAAA